MPGVIKQGLSPRPLFRVCKSTHFCPIGWRFFVGRSARLIHFSTDCVFSDGRASIEKPISRTQRISTVGPSYWAKYPSLIV